ncbi:MAG: hypothetical protein LBT78_05365 [Tannerella sp.]|jgi:hypothetical protein|nr:hypothetical protein [Tannerella sp.]
MNRKILIMKRVVISITLLVCVISAAQHMDILGHNKQVMAEDIRKTGTGGMKGMPSVANQEFDEDAKRRAYASSFNVNRDLISEVINERMVSPETWAVDINGHGSKNDKYLTTREDWERRDENLAQMQDTSEMEIVWLFCVIVFVIVIVYLIIKKKKFYPGDKACPGDNLRV